MFWSRQVSFEDLTATVQSREFFGFSCKTEFAICLFSVFNGLWFYICHHILIFLVVRQHQFEIILRFGKTCESGLQFLQCDFIRVESVVGVQIEGIAWCSKGSCTGTSGAIDRTEGCCERIRRGNNVALRKCIESSTRIVERSILPSK